MSTSRQIQGHFVLTPISPVHIGSGEILQGLDYTLRGDQFAVKDVLAFFEAHKDNTKYALDAVETGLDIGEDYVRYRIPACAEPARKKRGPQRGGPPRKDQPFLEGRRPRGRKTKMDAQMAKLQRQSARKYGASQTPKKPDPQSDGGGGEVRAFIKDPFGQVFFPATSFKGTVRTALACHLAEQAPDAFAAALRGVGRQRRQSPAFQPIKDALFGRSAHEDLLKALRIQDSQPLAPEACLFLAQVKVMNVFRGRFSEKRGVPIQAECLVPGTNGIRLPFQIDRFALERDHALKRPLKGTGAALLQDRAAFEHALRAHGAALAQYESDFYAGQNETRAQRFFQNLIGSQHIHLPVGFGTGWHTKTVGRLIPESDLARLRERGVLKRPAAAIFPKTRKWARCKEGELPMGWLKVAIEWK
ncbi:MAG: type III-A CRISPR-associated RAMP protein Csm5 [Candidatus Hydrogenedentales bacterium]|jgi:CRISPR type III-A-associated RAMP protein Csm5